MQQQWNRLFIICLLGVPLTYTMDKESEKPQIIVLQSTCSSGKTTLCAAFKKLTGNYEIVDEDQLCMDFCPLIIEECCSNEYQVIQEFVAPENRFHAINRREIIYVPDTPESSQKKVVDAIRAIEKVLNDAASSVAKYFKEEFNTTIDVARNDAIKEILGKGKNVILDSWMKDAAYYKEQFKDVHCKSALAYCPLPVAYKLFNKRNNRAKQEGLVRVGRFYGQFIFSNVGCYNVTADANAHTIDSCSPQELDQVFDDMEPLVVQDWQEAKQAPFSRREINLWHLTSQRNLFLPDEIKKEKIVYISPKKPSDFIVKTGTVTPEESAKDLFEKLKGR